MSTLTDKVKAWPKSEHGNFYAVDTIGVPHPYCITAKHVEIAADHFSGILGEDTIQRAEKMGAKCGICKGKLSWKEHEQAALIQCEQPLEQGDKINPELQAYLLALKPLAEEAGLAGFAFRKAD
jgi:hypothetical protein